MLLKAVRAGLLRRRSRPRRLFRLPESCRTRPPTAIPAPSPSTTSTLKEDTTITYKVNGRYDDAALQKINYAAAGLAHRQPTNMDPHLIDALWEVYRETGAKEPIRVIGGYRSPATNAMLRRRSSGVAKFSQHMLGKAIDFYIPGVELESIPRCRPAPPARRRRLLPLVGRALRPHGHRQRAPLAADAGGAARDASCPRVRLTRSGVQQPGGAEAAEIQAGGRRLAQRSRRGRGCRGRHQTDVARARDAHRWPRRRRRRRSRRPFRCRSRGPGRRRSRRNPVSILASASSQPVRARSRPPAEPEAAPSGFNLASASSQPVIPAAPRPAQAASLVPQATISANDIINERGYWQGLTDSPSGRCRRPTFPRCAPRRGTPLTAASRAAAWRRGR